MLKKIKKALLAYGEIVEIILAVFTAIAIGMKIIGFIPQFHELWVNRVDSETFALFLNGILSIIIGTEFIRMMLGPTMQNITEVLIFLISRHMIVEETTPTDNLISVISITILFMVQYFMVRNEKKEKVVDRAIGHLRHYIQHPVEISAEEQSQEDQSIEETVKK